MRRLKLLINTAHQRFGGAIQVALSFIHECRRFPEHEYYVWVGPGVRQSLREVDFPANFHFRHFDFGVIDFWKTFRINRTLQRVEKEVQPDCIIATSGPSYFHSRAPQLIGYNLPLYIYPESPFVQAWSPYRKLRMALKKRLHFYFFRRDAVALVVQTDDVNWRVRRALKTDQVHTVTNTHSVFYHGWEALPPKLPPRETGVFRFITVSAYYGHKNLEIIPEVLEELERRGRNQVQFVLTLKPEALQAKLGGDRGGRILNVGPIRPEECPTLYAECDALFLPTLAECFSASYPEAMVMDKPIITTDLGFAHSICGEAALYFEPKNAISAADAIERLLDDGGLRERLVEKGRQQLMTFDSAEERARKYLILCEQVATSRNQEKSA